MPIRILLVDDHPIVLQGLEHLFNRQVDCEVVGCCTSAAAAVEAARTQQPDVIVLDLRMSGRDGIGLLEDLAREWLPPRTVVLTAAITDEQVGQIIARGADGLVLKEASPQELMNCVRVVHAGERWFDPQSLSRAVEDFQQRDARAQLIQTLTSREQEVVRMVAAGLRNKEIGERLEISERTVKVHLHNIYGKLGVDGRLELLLFAQQKGLV